jgi:hypothetical protein
MGVLSQSDGGVGFGVGYFGGVGVVLQSYGGVGYFGGVGLVSQSYGGVGVGVGYF